MRQERSKPLVLELGTWLEQQLARSGKSLIADAIRYALNHWDGLTRFLDDGRVELDTNIVERGTSGSRGSWCLRAQSRHIHARQMGRKRAAIGAARFAARLCSHRALLVLSGFVCGDGLLDIFERQKQLLGIEFLRAPAELRTLKLPQEVPQAIVLQKRWGTLGHRGVTFRTHCRKERMQRFDIGRKLRCDLAHARIEPDSRTVVAHSVRHDSIRRSSHLTMSLSVAQRRARAAATNPSRAPCAMFAQVLKAPASQFWCQERGSGRRAQ